MAKPGTYPDFYPEVSGSIIELKDGVNNQNEQFLSGRKIMILGTATDGPVLDSVHVNSLEDAREIFGEYYDKETQTKNGTSLVRGFRRANEAGADNINLMRISGQEASAEIPLKPTTQEVIHDYKFTTIADGNARTVIDLEIPKTTLELDGYDNARVDNVSVTATSRALSSTSFDVENNNGIVTIHQDVANSKDEVTVEYDLVLESYQMATEGEEGTDLDVVLGTDALADDIENIWHIPDVYGNTSKRVATNPIEPLVPEEDRTNELQLFVELYDVSGTDPVLVNDQIVEADTDWYEGILTLDTAYTADQLEISYVYQNIISTEDIDVVNTHSNEYKLPNENIIPGSETITVELIGGSTVILDTTEYNLNYESGIVTIYNMEEYDSIWGVNYEYRETEYNPQTHREALVESRQRIELEHSADSRRPIVANGGRTGDIDDDDITINWNGDQTTVVWLEPGAVGLNENISINYYWVEEQLVEPVLAAKSIFAGDKYNEISIEVQDNIVELTDTSWKIEVGGELIEQDGQYIFPELGESQSVMADSVFIEDSTGQQLLGIDEYGNRIGAYTSDDAFTRPEEEINDETVWDFKLYKDKGRIVLSDTASVEPGLFANYAYEVSESKKVSLKRGSFNPAKTDAGDLGGGRYQEFDLDLSNGRTEALFNEDNLLPDYFAKTSEDEGVEEDNTKKIVFVRNITDPDTGETYNELELTMADYLAGTITVSDDGTDVDVTLEQDFVIDYANGVIEFDDNLALNEEVKVQEYAYYNVSSKEILIHKPEDKYETEYNEPIKIEGIGTDITNLAQLVDTINSHPRNNMILQVAVPVDFKAKSALELETPVRKLKGWNMGDPRAKVISFMGGKNEADLTNEQLYEKLGGTDEELGAYEVIQDIEDIDIIVPMEAYADAELLSNYKSFGQQLADVLGESFLRNNEIQGVLSTKPLQNPSRKNVLDKIRKLEELNTDFYMTDEQGNYRYDDAGNRIDIGRFVAIVGYDKTYADGNLAVPSTEGGAADFAGIASMSGNMNSPTNEATRSGQLAFQISTHQASRLIRNKIIPAKVKQGIPKILDATTCAQPGSGWTRWFTVDIVFDTIGELRGIFDNYIGSANELQQRSSLDSEIREMLKEKSTIVESDYNLLLDPSDPEMGRIIIELDLVPAAELQKIKAVVSINRSLAA